MMKLDTKHAFLKEDIAGYQDIVTKCHEDLHNKTGKGNDYVGWWNGQTIMTRKSMQD